MSIVKKIGYLTIIFWGYRLSRELLYAFYKKLLPGIPLDLYSMGRWGVVTGCANGIGRAYAEALAKNGINVVLINTGIEKSLTIANDIEATYGVKTKVVELNLSKGLETYKAIEKETYGLDVGILINSFGISYPHPEYFLDLPSKEKIYMNIIQCNIVVVTNMCRIFLPQMVLRGRGVIVNVASSSAVMPSPLLTVFAASKAYVLKFTRDLHAEYSKHGVIIQCLLPGTVSNENSESCSSGWLTPSPGEYVASALEAVGRDAVTTGFLSHSLIVGIVRCTCFLSSSLVIKGMSSAMESYRAQALRRYVG